MAIFEKQAYLDEENPDCSGNISKKNEVSRFKDPHIPQNRKDERTFVHLCWIYMWCGTLWQ